MGIQNVSRSKILIPWSCAKTTRQVMRRLAITIMYPFCLIRLWQAGPCPENTVWNNSKDADKATLPRLLQFPGYMARYLGSENEKAVNAYCDLAEKCNLTPTEFALSWCYHNELVSSTIIGATTMEQLEENLKAYDVRLDGVEVESSSMDEEISKIYKQY